MLGDWHGLFLYGDLAHRHGCDTEGHRLSRQTGPETERFSAGIGAPEGRLLRDQGRRRPRSSPRESPATLLKKAPRPWLLAGGLSGDRGARTVLPSGSFQAPYCQNGVPAIWLPSVQKKGRDKPGQVQGGNAQEGRRLAAKPTARIIFTTKSPYMARQPSAERFVTGQWASPSSRLCWRPAASPPSPRSWQMWRDATPRVPGVRGWIRCGATWRRCAGTATGSGVKAPARPAPPAAACGCASSCPAPDRGRYATASPAPSPA